MSPTQLAFDCDFVSACVLSEPGEYGMLVLRAAQGGQRPALLQEEQGRDAADGKPFRQQGVFLGVDLDDHSLSGKFSGNFPHHRCEVSAVRSPGGPELGEDRA